MSSRLRMYGGNLFHYLQLCSYVQSGGNQKNGTGLLARSDDDRSDEGDNDLDDALVGKKLQLGEVLEKFAEMYKTKDAEYFSFFIDPYPLGPR